MRKHLPLLLTLLGVGLAVWYGLFPLQHDRPVIVGAEQGPEGVPRRRIVYESTHRRFMPGPGGFVRYGHYFLETPGAPRRELTFLRTVVPDEYVITDLCTPVAGTPLWVVAGYLHRGTQIDVIVFDPAGVKTHRTIPVTQRETLHDYWFEDGNHTLRYHTPGGTGSYDVTTDTVAGESGTGGG